jgi:hypothetical protein
MPRKPAPCLTLPPRRRNNPHNDRLCPDTNYLAIPGLIGGPRRCAKNFIPCRIFSYD